MVGLHGDFALRESFATANDNTDDKRRRDVDEMATGYECALCAAVRAGVHGCYSLCRSTDVYDGLQAVVCNADRMVRKAYYIANVDTLRRLECGDELPAYDHVYFMRCLAATTTSACG